MPPLAGYLFGMRRTMQSFTTNFLNAISLTVEQASTLSRIGEYRGKQDLFSKQTPETLKSLQQVAIIESSESSNRIEGVTAPHDRIEALVLKSAIPRDRSEQEIAGYRDGLALIHESAEHMAFSVNIILQLHSMLLRYMPNEGGRWKMTNNDIVEKNPDGTIKRIRFKPVSPVATLPAMDALVAGYKDAIENQRKEPMVIIPLAILDFLCIHPFSDGNGCVARLLTLLLLSHATGGSASVVEYQSARNKLLSIARIKAKLPRFVHTCRDLDQFWAFIKA